MDSMERIEAVYKGVRDTERGRIAVVILVHMLYVARAARVLEESGARKA